MPLPALGPALPTRVRGPRQMASMGKNCLYMRAYSWKHGRSCSMRTRRAEHHNTRTNDRISKSSSQKVQVTSTMAPRCTCSILSRSQLSAPILSHSQTLSLQLAAEHTPPCLGAHVGDATRDSLQRKNIQSEHGLRQQHCRMSLVASWTRPVTIVTWDLDSNVPSEAFAVGCGETLGTPAGLVHDKGDRSGTEQRSTLIQRRNSSLLLTHMAIIFQCAPSCLIRLSTWQPGRERASPSQPSVMSTLQALKCVQCHHPYQPLYKPNCSRTASRSVSPLNHLRGPPHSPRRYKMWQIACRSCH